MKNKTLVRIREEDCIGCAKCIAVCPVDAILGSPKQMHTVIADECIGCDLCLPPCPVDCIEHVPMDQPRSVTHTRARVQARKTRLGRIEAKTHSPDRDPKSYVADIMKRMKS